MTDDVSIVNCNTSSQISHEDGEEESPEEGEIKDDSSEAESSDPSKYKIHSTRKSPGSRQTARSRQPKFRSPVPYASGRMGYPPCVAEVYSEPAWFEPSQSQDVVERREKENRNTASRPMKELVIRPVSRTTRPSVLSSTDHGLPRVTSKHVDSHKLSREHRVPAPRCKRRRYLATEKQERRVSPTSRRDSRSVSESSDIEAQIQKTRARPGINKFNFRERAKVQTAPTSFVSAETPSTDDKNKNFLLENKEELETPKNKEPTVIDLTDCAEDNEPPEVSSKSTPNKLSESDEETSLDKEELNLRVIALQSAIRARYGAKKKPLKPKLSNVTSALSKCDQPEADVSLVDMELSLTDDEKDQSTSVLSQDPSVPEESVVEQNKVENSGVLSVTERALDSTENTDSSALDDEDDEFLRAQLLVALSNKHTPRETHTSATSPSVSDSQSVSAIPTSGGKTNHTDAKISLPLNSLKNVASHSSSSSLSPIVMLSKEVAVGRPALLAGPTLSLTTQLPAMTPRMITLPTPHRGPNPYKVSKSGNKLIRRDIYKKKKLLMQTSKNLKKKGKDILGTVSIPSLPELAKMKVSVTSDAVPGGARPQVDSSSSSRLVICLGEDSDSDSEEGPLKDRDLLPTEKSLPSDLMKSVDQFLKQVRQNVEQREQSQSPINKEQTRAKCHSVPSSSLVETVKCIASQPESLKSLNQTTESPKVQDSKGDSVRTKEACLENTVKFVSSDKTTELACSNLGVKDSSVGVGMDVISQVPAKVVKSLAVVKKSPNKIAILTKVVPSNLASSPSLSPSADLIRKKTMPVKRIAIKKPCVPPQVRELPGRNSSLPEKVGTPGALRHLPSSQQMEYHRLKLEIARREELKKLKSRLGPKLSSETSKLEITVSTQGADADLVRTVRQATPPVSVLTPEQAGETRSALEATEQSQTSEEKAGQVSFVGPVMDVETPTSKKSEETVMPAAGVKRKRPTIKSARSKQAKSAHSETPAVSLQESPIEEKHDRLNSAEKELVAERRQMLGQLSLLAALLGDVNRGQAQVRDSEARVEALRRELTRAEERAEEKRAAIKKLFAQVGQVRSEVAQTRTRCGTLSKSCLALGQSTCGADYQLPQEESELLRSHLQLVVSLTKPTRDSQSPALSSSSASSETSGPKVPVSKLSVGQAGPVIQLSESQSSVGSSSPARDSTPTSLSSKPHHRTDLPADQIQPAPVNSCTSLQKVIDRTSQNDQVTDNQLQLFCASTTETNVDRGFKEISDICIKKLVSHQPARRNSMLVDESKSSVVELSSKPFSCPCSPVPLDPLSMDLAPSPPPSQVQGAPAPRIPPQIVPPPLAVLQPYVSPLQHMMGASWSPLGCSRSPAAEEALDPHKMLCPFALTGICLDDECQFQHPYSSKL